MSKATQLVVAEPEPEQGALPSRLLSSSSSLWGQSPPLSWLLTVPGTPPPITASPPDRGPTV